jgi:DNA-binding NarL/FixJ family response regulator
MRVLVADDHSLFRDGIISLLEAGGFDVVGQVGNGRAAVEATVRLRPDVVLMDIDMPQMDGLQALALIKQEFPETQVVMLTVSEDDANLYEAVKFGADGYLLKNLTANQFYDMLDGLQRGEAAMTRQTTAHLMKGLAGGSSLLPSLHQELTQREIELLQLMADGMSNKVIAETLCVSENTVKYHLKNMMQKLGVQNRTEAVAHAMRIGLLDGDVF